jgi:two-component system, response regulator PdtaR
MSGKAVRVMVVEDESLVSDFMAAVLDDTLYQVVGVAETGADALQLAAEARPDVALVDINLRGGMDGVELAAHVRERWPSIRLVFVSGSHDPATRTRAEALTPDGFLKKPFMARHLLAVLEGIDRGNPGGVG